MKKQRIVVKIGNSSLTNEKGGIDQNKLQDHVDAVAELRKLNHEVILVSSGAIAAGFSSLGYPSRPVTVKGKQAAAAVGQSLLIQSYIEKFAPYGIIPAQILLTRSDFSNRERYRNAFATIMELLARDILPIINENDTVSIEELTFGDNDMLSALVSGFIHANQLIILTDIDGIYEDDPRKNPHAKKFDYLNNISDSMIERVGGAGSKVGTGGMKSKLLAAKTAQSLGVPVFIGKGEGPKKLVDILLGKGNGTYISCPTATTINTKRQWIALHSELSGKIYIDQGAEEAILYNGKSLLPAGVFKVQGTFQKGDVVEVFGKNGLIGKGQVRYSSEELKELISKRIFHKDMEQQIGTKEVIHRDQWVQLMKGEEII